MNAQSIVSIAASFVGSLGFSMLYNLRGKRLLINAVGGALAWWVYLLLHAKGLNDYANYFIVALLITLYAEIWARIAKTPATTFLIPSVIPLIPGGALYYAVAAALRGDVATLVERGYNALGLAIALAVGILVITSIFGILHGFLGVFFYK